MGKVTGEIGALGPIVDVTVARAASEIEHLHEIGNYSSHTVRALFDTGSDVTLIHRGFAETLQLVPYDRAIIRGVHNRERSCNLFNVDLRFERDAKLFLRLPDVRVAEVEFASLTENVRVILGRSVMWKGRFIYDARKPNKMRFTFER